MPNPVCGDSRTVLHFGYDKSGNQVAKDELSYAGTTLLGDDSWSITFDGLNRLNGVVTPDAEWYRYTYSGDRLRVEKRSPEQTSRYVWDGDDVVAELRTDEPIQSMTRGLGVISQASGDAVSYFLHNVRGDVIALYGQDGTNQAGYAYSPYGEVLGGESVGNLAPANVFLHNEQYRDPETGFYYLRARYYDASIGRFLSEDPAKSASLLLYLFAAGNPIRYADITGLAPTWACVGNTWTNEETTTWMLSLTPEQGLMLLGAIALVILGVEVVAGIVCVAAAGAGATATAAGASAVLTDAAAASSGLAAFRGVVAGVGYARGEVSDERLKQELVDLALGLVLRAPEARALAAAKTGASKALNTKLLSECAEAFRLGGIEESIAAARAVLQAQYGDDIADYVMMKVIEAVASSDADGGSPTDDAAGSENDSRPSD